MSRFDYTEKEKQFNKVLKHQENLLSETKPLDNNELDRAINSSEELLASLGYSYRAERAKVPSEKHPAIQIPEWDELCKEVEDEIKEDVILEDLFSAEEMAANRTAIQTINRDFKEIYKLDKYDYIIAALGAILGGATDILMVGIPHSDLGGGGIHKPLSDYIRKRFEEKYPPGMLENLKSVKVPYDAQYNRHTETYVEGLSSYYHRLLSLGHDPLLGFIVGVMDIMNGTMTTIDRSGHFVSQVMKVYEDRKEAGIFEALAKQILHLKSDITTSMGLPVPLMGLFNLLQTGSIGDENKMISEIVQEMYHEGYDFIHFCSMSIPAMVTEVVVRIGHAYKRLKECDLPTAVKSAVSLDRTVNPKLGTLLFIAHAGAAAINAGKVHFSGGDPLAINYPQWAAFALYSYKQLKWILIQKPELQNQYVQDILNNELSEIVADIDNTYQSFASEYIFVMT